MNMEQLIFGGLLGIILMVIVNRLRVPPAPNIIMVQVPQPAPQEPPADGCMPIIMICMIVVVVLWLSGAL
jgi:hypothetical protein